MMNITFSNGIELDLLFAGEIFLGIGKVRCGDVALRSGERPMFVEIRNPSGIELLNYRIANEQVKPESACFQFKMQQRAGGLIEFMVHEVRPRYNTKDWTAAPCDVADTSLRLELNAVNRTLGGREYRGFSYRYYFRSDSVPIYKILDRGTWELNGRVVGNEFWMRNCFVPSIVKIESVEQFHSTEWYIPDCANPNAFQFLPLQTELQGFTFTASPQGTLITWATEVAHIRSLFEKPRGADTMVHFHEHCGDLAYEFSTSPMEVLFAAGELNRTEQANAYEAVHELVHETLHAAIGMRRERVTTYGQIEEWGPAQLDRYAELGVPKLHEAGMKTIYIGHHFQNNMNTWGVGNMCCTVDYQVAESVGRDKLTALCAQIREADAQSMMWGNSSISTLSWIFAWDRKENGEGRIHFLPHEGSVMHALENAEAPFVRNASYAIEADHYTPIFCALNLRDAMVREYWLKRWGEAHDDVGLGGIFLDSSFNLSSDKFHWIQNADAGRTSATSDQAGLLGFYRPSSEPRAEILSQYRAHLDLMVEMQRLGYIYCNEDLGVFGTHRHGPGLEKRLDSLFMWAECIANFDALAIHKAGADPEEIFFRGLAYRLMWTLHWNIEQDALSFRYEGIRGDYDRPSTWHLALFKAFNEVGDFMRGREILPGETGVIYRGEKRQIVWAFEDVTLPLPPNKRVRDVLNDECFSAEELRARRHRIYAIEVL